MAKQFTGIDGALYADGSRIAQVTTWQFQGKVDELETTTLGDYARTYVYGVQSYSGSCTLLYYEESNKRIAGRNLMTDVMRTTQTPTEPTHNMELRYLNGAATHSVRFNCILPTVSISASVGGIITAQVSFTVCGRLTASSIV